jgi:hypothetical protein
MRGYCLPPERQEEILAAPPATPDAFVDAVLSGEFDRDSMDISLDVDKRERELLLGIVTDWLFDNGGGRGTRSGLPRFPGASDHSA